jgi:CDGSH-type Zn-finger protein
MTEPTIIRVVQNGPYQVTGDFRLVDHANNVVPTTPGKRVSLCRCGGSTTKPFCDGTHSRIGFQGAAQAVRESDKS